MKPARNLTKDGWLGSSLGRAPSRPKSWGRAVARPQPPHLMLYTILLATCFASAATADDSLASREEAALRAAAERVADSVVQIRTIGGLETIGGTVLADGPTTGLVISEDGYIVSSAFNFVQQPASILVTFASGKQAPAELVAKDHSRMIVLLKADGVHDLPVPELAPADEIRVGQWAVAVGRTYRADRTNVSVGIVSAVGRMFGKVLQTDADVSTANYGGPLVDLRGRVLGVIVPMAPQGTSEVAGVEWYDSGIGFAVPLAAIADRLVKMENGEDQRAGILGIGLEPKNPHSAPAKLAAVRPDGPAGKAGLKKGDRIVEFEGQPIRTQTDLRFALGPRYADDRVNVVIERDKERLERTITLVGKLPTFRHAFLGILPLRPAAEPAEASNEDADHSNDKQAGTDPAAPDADNGDEDKSDDDRGAAAANADSDNEDAGKVEQEKGVAVRFVYEGSPAEKAGVRVGDSVVRINDAAVQSIEVAIAEMNNAAPESEIALRILRNGKPMDLKLTAARLPTSVPAKLPDAFAPTPAADDAAAEDAAADATKPGETLELKLPEFPQQCKVYVPASHADGRAQGVLFFLHAPSKANADETIQQWKPICDRDGLLVVVPTAADSGGWERTEREYLGRLTEKVMNQYKIDPRRVVVYGEHGGGAMAWHLSLAGRHVFRGVATSAAPLPRQIRVPENEPTERLAVFAAMPAAKNAALQIAQGLQKLSEAGYPVTTITPAEAGGALNDAERQEFARWIDTLDRF